MPRILLFTFIVLGLISCQKEYDLTNLQGGSNKNLKSIQSGIDGYSMNFLYSNQAVLDSVWSSTLNESYKVNIKPTEYRINIGDGTKKYFVINNGRVKQYYEVLPNSDTMVIDYVYVTRDNANYPGLFLDKKVIVNHRYNGTPDLVDSLRKIEFAWERGNLISSFERKYNSIDSIWKPMAIYEIEFDSTAYAPDNFIQFLPGFSHEQFFLNVLNLAKKSTNLIKNISKYDLSVYPAKSSLITLYGYQKDQWGNIISVNSTDGKTLDPLNATIDPLKKFGGTINYSYW